MGLNTIGAQGIPLPLNVLPYPSLPGQPQIAGGPNRGTLPPGGDFIIPPGTYALSRGQYSFLQVLDPETGVWMGYATQDTNSLAINISTDGSNYRIINPLGFPIAAMVNNGGTGYTSAPAVASTPGNALWTAVVGGGIGAININSGGSGANWGSPPGVIIGAPPFGGVQATAVCAISGGSISSITVTNPGGGYTSAPAVAFFPQSADTSFLPGNLAFVPPKATAQLSYVGVVTAVILNNEGSVPLTAAPALSFTGGGGSGATATAIMALTITGVTISTPGSGYSTPVVIQSIGGTVTSAAAVSNSASISTGLMIPRQATIQATVSSGGVSIFNGNPNTPGGIIDGGIFQTAPQLYATPGPIMTATSNTGLTAAIITPIMGFANDFFFFQAL